MQYYDEISKGYNELHKEEQLNKIRIITDYDFTDKSILDVGCGPGYLFDYLIENNIKFKSYTGIDPSLELMKLNKHYDKSKFIKSKIEDFKLKNYDVIVAVTSIHNFDDIHIIKRFKQHAKYFIFSILKKSKKFEGIKNLIKENFKVEKVVDEQKDMIYFLE